MSDSLNINNRLIGIEEQKTIQLSILDSVDRFCRENGIKYSLYFGSLLGAVRHKGYIPWDDDIDIAMDRENYNRFINTFPALLDGKYMLASIERMKEWHAPFSKVYDNRTIVYDKLARTAPIGLSIDVFPCDEVPDDIDKRKKYLRIQRFLIRLNAIKLARISGVKKRKKQLVLLLCKSIMLIIPRRFLLHMWAKHTVVNNGLGNRNVFSVAFFSTAISAFDKCVFDEIIPWEFEDRHYLGFKNADYYLTSTYGDYMKLPPKEQQVNAHFVEAQWKHNMY